MASPSIKVSHNGPYIVQGSIPLTKEAMETIGDHRAYRITETFPTQEVYALCRCGHTSTPPYCDGTHTHIDFDGAEQASRQPFDQRAKTLHGKDLTLFDDGRCAFARFCHRETGDAWSLTEETSNPFLKSEAIKASSQCPSGRLVHKDTQDGSVYEPPLKTSIAILEDFDLGMNGPLYVRGGVLLEDTQGNTYETRNRYALCRCGLSNIKPFCDAMHISFR